METLKDNFNEIAWFKDDRSYEANQIVEELDSWQSDNIKRYISDAKLGFTFRGICDYEDDVDQFFGFSDKKLVSAILVHKNKEECVLDELKKHIENNALKKNFAYRENPLSSAVAERILDDGKYDEIYYLTVNPNEQKKGYGTRVVGSIKNNQGFFFPNKECCDLNKIYTLGTKIHFKNTPSMTVFYNNGFKQINKPPHMVSELTKFFLEDMEK